MCKNTLVKTKLNLITSAITIISQVTYSYNTTENNDGTGITI